MHTSTQRTVVPGPAPTSRSKLPSLLASQGLIVSARQSPLQCLEEIRGKPFLFESEEEGCLGGFIRTARVTADMKLQIWVDCANIAYFETASAREGRVWIPYRLHPSSQYVWGHPGNVSLS